MSFTNAWVEADPDGNVIFVSQLDDAIRVAKAAIRERLEGDPAAPNLTGLIESGSFTSAPKPRKGAARIYVDSQANILAFGVDKREDGRLAIANDTQRLFHVSTAAVLPITIADAGLPTGSGAHQWALGLASSLDIHFDNTGVTFKVTGGANTWIQADRIGIVGGDTALSVWDETASTHRRVTRGAVDSGGSGFRVLRIPN